MENIDMEQIFSSIYKRCAWGTNENPNYAGSSGDGSTPEYNQEYINFIKNFITENKITSVSDAGCGDWRLGSAIFLDTDIEYTGYDVYSELIRYLNTEYIKPNLNFVQLDIFNRREEIKNADLLIIKDVMQHWDDNTTENFVNWITQTNKFKFVLITNCVSGTQGMTTEGVNGGWRGLDIEHPFFKNKGFTSVFRYNTKEVILYDNKYITIKDIYKFIGNFKIDKKYWNYINLSGEDYDKRSKPGPYLKTTIEIAKMLGLKNVVEIGSTRYAVSPKCIDYFNKDYEPFNSPPCCTDGHGGFFFTDAGFNVHTVDIDINCQTQIEWSYNNLGREFPSNLKTHIPYDGIDFLKNFDEKIDVLFLDGWDVGTQEYAEKHLEAYLSAKDKLSDTHLILIDDTDFTLGTGGKDYLLTPYLIDNGYIPLMNGRQTLFINNDDFQIKVLENKKTEQKIDFENNPLVIISLSTTPTRLHEIRDGWGVKPVLERLLNMSYRNYEIHFNIPFINHKTNEEYVLPNWLIELSYVSPKLKIFRCHDFGSITKIVPTLKRVEDPNAIIITVDDDLIYIDGFIEYHLKKMKQYPNTALGFAGLTAINGTCHHCTTMNVDTRVKILEGYKTVSYLRKFFENDFFTDFVGKSWSDDIIISAYLGKQNIPKIVMNYDMDDDFRPRVESFPIVGGVPNERSGCTLYRAENISDNSTEYYKLGFLER
jgi:hypothetical protein